MPDDMMQDAMVRLASDPHEFRRRQTAAMAKMAKIISDPPESAKVDCSFELDSTLAPAYEVCRAFYGMLFDGDLEADDMTVMYIFCQGLQAELRKIEKLRDRLYKMGSLETQADALGMDIGDEERRVMASETDVTSKQPPSLDDYFGQGYVGCRCPNCRKKAVWHPVRHDLICLDGCGNVGDFDRRPGPS